MRLHALVSNKNNKYLPGRVLKYNQNGTVDVEVEGGIVKHGLNGLEVMIGLTVGQEIEARKPNVVVLNSTSVMWNCNSSLLASSYGRDDMAGWCENPGAICIWRIFNKNIVDNVPDIVLDHTASLMCCKFHPVNPSIIAGGSFNGEVIVWDLNIPEVPIRISIISDDSHTEPIADLEWIYDSQSQSYLLVSAGCDGKVCISKYLHRVF
jgi:WD40 repeat protein